MVGGDDVALPNLDLEDRSGELGTDAQLRHGLRSFAGTRRARGGDIAFSTAGKAWLSAFACACVATTRAALHAGRRRQAAIGPSMRPCADLKIVQSLPA